MTELDIQDKIDELREWYINDDDYLIDALVDCLDKVRELRYAKNQDDRLNAVDELVDAINKNVQPLAALRIEAINLLDNDSDNDSTSDMDDAGHKESDFR